MLQPQMVLRASKPSRVEKLSLANIRAIVGDRYFLNLAYCWGGPTRDRSRLHEKQVSCGRSWGNWE
jgi:hypothetical protein